MIVKFRENHIVRLERLHKEAGGSLLPKEQDDLFSELREELQMLKEQVSSFVKQFSFVRIAHAMGGYRPFRKSRLERRWVLVSFIEESQMHRFRVCE